MKNLKSRSVKIKSGVLAFAVIFLVAACAKFGEPLPSGTSTDGASSEKIASKKVKDQNHPLLPLIIVTSMVSPGTGNIRCIAGKNSVTVSLESLTCSSYVTGGQGYLYYNWKTLSCPSPGQGTSTYSNLCNPSFCLTSGQTWYLVVSTQSGGLGSTSSCYSIYVP